MEPKSADEWKALFLSTCASLTLTENTGDVVDVVGVALKRAGVEGYFDDLNAVFNKLAELGVCTLCGMRLQRDDEP